MSSELRARPQQNEGGRSLPALSSTTATQSIRPPNPSSRRPRPRHRSSNVLGVSPFVLAFFLLISLSWSFISIHYDLPPYKWVSDYKHRHDKVIQHRPAFKKVERYSPKHRYRPAASPVIKIKDKDGNVKKVKGQYHP